MMGELDEETGGSDPAMGRRIFSQVFYESIWYISLSLSLYTSRLK